MFDKLRTMILDEADEMLRMGFDKDIEKIYGYIMEDRE
jgi:superfamily II DNA/RNA helicase